MGRVAALKSNKKLIIGIIAIVLVTAFISFSVATGVFFYLYNASGPRISFEKGVDVTEVRKFNKVKSLIERNYFENVDENKLIEGAIGGMASGPGDPYTVYFPKKQMQDFMEKSSGSYSGIGIYISVDPKDNLITVIAPIEGTPAEKAGILPGDKIIRVDDKDITSEKDEDKVVSMIKGLDGTKVRITVYRPSKQAAIDFEIMRQKIKIKNIKYEVVDGNIGYIRLVLFSEDISSDFQAALNDLYSKNIRGLIVDLRDNPGGSYEEVVRIADMLVPEGTIVYTQDKYGKKEYQKSDKNEIHIPLALLVNGNSASASEILSGAVKDFKKGTLVGKKTFGKGLVQNIFPLEDGSGLKVTIARYFTPSGVCIQGIGITPDIEVSLPEQEAQKPISQVKRENDTQYAKALEMVKSQIK